MIQFALVEELIGDCIGVNDFHGDRVEARYVGIIPVIRALCKYFLRVKFKISDGIGT